METADTSSALMPVVRNPSMDVVLSDGRTLTARHNPKLPPPAPHAPWKLKKVIAGHTGWVRCVAFDPATNAWFATGSADRTIKIWDFPSGTLKLTLTGHISTVRALAVSESRPYLFSAGEDRKVLCWDLEQNKIVRNFHGHFHGVYSMALHPRLDCLITGSRDGSARVWDLRTRSTIHCLAGHRSTVSAVLASDADPQIITGSQDSEIRLWDLAAGKTRLALTHHKKGVRALAAHPHDWTFCSGAADAVKRFALPDGVFLNNCELHLERQADAGGDANSRVIEDYDFFYQGTGSAEASLDPAIRADLQRERKQDRRGAISESIINCLAINEDGVVFGGSDDGVMRFWDYRSGRSFQTCRAPVQPGSLECEAGILAASFDKTGLRLVTGEVDKTIKIWAEDQGSE